MSALQPGRRLVLGECALRAPVAGNYRLVFSSYGSPVNKVWPHVVVQVDGLLQAVVTATWSQIHHRGHLTEGTMGAVGGGEGAPNHVQASRLALISVGHT